MELAVSTAQGRRFIEGAPGQPPLERADDVVRALVEACFGESIHALLLYPENLSARFFDLSSGEAGEILQKLRNYQIRLAIVRTPSLRLSSRFGELLADEQRGPYFRLFDTREAAQEWLCAG
jgi:hypothetical protein